MGRFFLQFRAKKERRRRARYRGPFGRKRLRPCSVSVLTDPKGTHGLSIISSRTRDTRQIRIVTAAFLEYAAEMGVDPNGETA
jgi:hypothetical protein